MDCSQAFTDFLVFSEKPLGNLIRVPMPEEEEQRHDLNHNPESPTHDATPSASAASPTQRGDRAAPGVNLAARGTESKHHGRASDDVLFYDPNVKRFSCALYPGFTLEKRKIPQDAFLVTEVFFNDGFGAAAPVDHGTSPQDVSLPFGDSSESFGADLIRIASFNHTDVVRYKNPNRPNAGQSPLFTGTAKSSLLPVNPMDIHRSLSSPYFSAADFELGPPATATSTALSSKPPEPPPTSHYLCAVFDGHGHLGHIISDYVTKHFPGTLSDPPALGARAPFVLSCSFFLFFVCVGLFLLYSVLSFSFLFTRPLLLFVCFCYHYC